MSASDAIKEVSEGIQKLDLAIFMAKHDAMQRYHRSKLGILWITASTAIYIGGIGLVFGSILNVPTDQLIPFLAIGLILWNFLAANINDGCIAFVNSSQIILQNALQLAFFMTPIMWMPEHLPEKSVWLLSYNPFAHLLSIVRDPLLGKFPTLSSWQFSMALLFVTGLMAIFMLSRFRKIIAYWL